MPINLLWCRAALQLWGIFKNCSNLIPLCERGKRLPTCCRYDSAPFGTFPKYYPRKKTEFFMTCFLHWSVMDCAGALTHGLHESSYVTLLKSFFFFPAQIELLLVIDKILSMGVGVLFYCTNEWETQELIKSLILLKTCVPLKASLGTNQWCRSYVVCIWPPCTKMATFQPHRTLRTKCDSPNDKAVGFIVSLVLSSCSVTVRLSWVGGHVAERPCVPSIQLGYLLTARTTTGKCTMSSPGMSISLLTWVISEIWFLSEGECMLLD